MTTEKEMYEKTLKDHIERVTTPIFNKVLQETNPNPMMVGTVQEIKFLWQPHNYRLYFSFNKAAFKPPKHQNKNYKPTNYGCEHQFVVNNCKVTIKKNQAEVINNSHNKQWRLITSDSIPQIKGKIDEVVSNLNNQGIQALKQIIKRYGGISDFKIIKIRGEHGIHGIDYLDRIPEDMIIHDTIFKKVYKGKVEFYDPANIKNYVSNMALQEVAPDVAEAINKFGAMLTGNINLVSQLANLNLEITKLRKDVTKLQKKPIKNNKDLRKWL